MFGESTEIFISGILVKMPNPIPNNLVFISVDLPGLSNGII